MQQCTPRGKQYTTPHANVQKGNDAAQMIVLALTTALPQFE